MNTQQLLTALLRDGPGIRDGERYGAGGGREGEGMDVRRERNERGEVESEWFVDRY